MLNIYFVPQHIYPKTKEVKKTDCCFTYNTMTIQTLIHKYSVLRCMIMVPHHQMAMLFLNTIAAVNKTFFIHCHLPIESDLCLSHHQHPPTRLQGGDESLVLLSPPLKPPNKTAGWR